MIRKPAPAAARVTLRAVLLACAAVGLAPISASAQDALSSAFANPPDSARPRVWWHWMNANVTKEGIQKDLEWMKRVGVAGFQNFDGGTSTIPRIVPPVIYESPEWKDAFGFAMQTAKRLGLEGARASSAGWSETGGPSVQPHEGMKKYVWSETWVEGGRAFTGVLAKPPTTSGPFQDVPIDARAGTIPEYYADARVFAYRVPTDAGSQAALAPTISASALAAPVDLAPLPKLAANAPAPPPPPAAVAPSQIVESAGVPLDLAMLSDGRLARSIKLAATRNTAPTWVRFDYARPVTVSGLTIGSGGLRPQFIVGSVFQNFGEPDGGPRVRVEASDDGRAWRAVAEDFYNGAQRTIATPATTARHFRIVFLEAATPPRVFRGSPPDWVPAIELSELALHTRPTVHRFEVKANFSNVNDYFAIPTPDALANRVVAKSEVVDLTGRMEADGRLAWTPPAGRWIVVRLGYSLTGHQNGPAPAEATGLEVDKLNARHVGKYMDDYLRLLTEAAGKENIGKEGLQYILNDSYEAGFQNWTEDVLDQFRARRGYDPSPFLPALTGAVVQSAAESDKFLYDFRRTLGELLVDSHYKVVSDKARAAGLGAYQEAHEDRRAYFGDDMEMRQHADIPMGAMWSFGPDAGPRMSFQADDRGAASVANIYGKKFVAAESFTGGGYPTTPNVLKHVADVELVNGINRFVVHTSAHQPADKGPGMSLMGIGVFFSRNETWAELAKGWTDYLGRASHMLQQGRAATEVAYFYGQEAPITGIWAWEYQKDAPEGFDYDYVNADVILNRLKVENGRLVTPTGMNYRILYMGERTGQITLPVLRKLRDFVEAGAVLVGRKPTNSPSLADDNAEFQRIATALWGAGADGERSVGRGKVFTGRTANQVLSAIGATKDFDYTRRQPDTTLWFKHRRLDDGDLYFVVNRNNAAQDVEVSLRPTGKAVEMWDPVTGRISPASYRTEAGRTVVPLKLGALDSTFLVLRQPGPPARATATPVETRLADVDGAWTVEFQPEHGAPASAQFDSLRSWTESTDPGVRYFSGLATYRKSVEAPSSWFSPGARLWLDLGVVGELADVTVNGKPLGVVWRAPYRVDVTDALRPGRNEVVVRVANTWVNRLIGDKQPGATPVAFSLSNPYTETTPLPRSGLLGPVQVIQQR